ncbi:probable folate-biopterin transporter 4 isoform X1 [Dendrobium catenatum]|uniref:Putative folate-biopterin transporter 4 n=1 Tax=Dendrobium catenatum TaxID=906689 RepID=A0A2I0X5W3_9ASPA|nr:probable folate-biopterin transporter 4 isoform X1 [Dendrobium catenatum]PKU83309.1 putative folate-biopterin transporter 4 [Dendrobium catenatum]
MAIRWMRRMGGSFGASFLWIVSLIYFTQGFRSFVWTAVSYQMKDILKLSPSSSQFMFSIAFFPWSIKPAYGILSDCIPINGCKRKPYLVIATVLSLIPWPVLGLISSLMNSHNFLTALLTMQNLGSAMADVVIDAMIAEAVRSERAEFAGDLQSLSWLMMAVGGICGNLLGGYALSSFRICSIFLLFSILPGIQLLSCAFIKEASSEYPDIGDLKNSNLQERLYSSTISPVGASKSEALRRRKKERNHDCSKLSYREAEDVKEKGSLALSLRRFQSMRSAIYSLYDAFKNPLILRPMAWFFFSHVAVPNLSTVMFYYQTQVLHLGASFLGASRVIGWFGLMIGTYIYNQYLKRMKLQRILMLAHVGLGAVNFLDIVLVSGLNTRLSIPDKYMVLGGSAVADAINQFKLMPFLILSGQLCPPGIEGTLFALFMSINNLGSSVGSFYGAALASVLGISTNSFRNILYGLLIQLFSTFIPIGLLFLIPKEATGLASEKL